MADWRSMQKARRGQLERHPSASGVPLSRGGGSEATEHGVAACHLRGQSEREAHGLPFTDWLATDLLHMVSKQATYRAAPEYCAPKSPPFDLE